MTGAKYRVSSGDCPSGFFGLMCIADGTNAATITVTNPITGFKILNIVTKQPLNLYGPIWAQGCTSVTVSFSGTGAGAVLFEAYD